MNKRRKILLVLVSLVMVFALAGIARAKTYDFGDGAKINKWAYKGYDNTAAGTEYNPEYEEEFTDAEYAAISASDGNEAEYTKTDWYEFHRFRFKIEEDISNISQIHVSHEGYGKKGANGLELFIWNYTDSKWESVGSHFAGTDVTIKKTFTTGISHYVSDDGYLELLAETKYSAGTCPYLYTWNGGKFEFIADFNTPGGLGYYDASGGQPYLPKSEDYVKIDSSQLKAVDGTYRLEIAEDQNEITYLDQVKLLVVDHPQGTEIHTPTMTKFAQPYPFKVYTIRNAKVPISAVDENGADILPIISKVDRIYTEGKDFYWDTITLDLGDLSGAKQIKLLLNAWVDWPLVPGVAARYMTEEYRAVVEVINEDGEWEEVSIEEPLGLPQALPRTHVIDITDWFKTDDYRLNISYWEKVPFDYIAVDTSEDEEVSVIELDPISANLHWKGVAREFLPDGKKPHVADYYTTVNASGFERFIGNFTRYGDVLPLLTQVDDKFVIMAAGDDISLAFDEVPISDGMERDYFLFSDAYYKQPFVRILLGEDVSRVKPLPFHGMSAYPYPEDESYPYDAEHIAYLEEYNTREFKASPSGESGHHTIYTDYVRVEITTPKNSDWTTAAPTIDGNFSEGEWTNAQLLIEDPIHTYVYFTNDDSFLYVCVDAANELLGDYTQDDGDYCDLFFDTGHDEAWTPGHEDWFRIWGDGTKEHLVALETLGVWGYCCDFSAHPGLEGAVGFGGSPNSGYDPPYYHRIYEFKIPLSLLLASPGDTIGFASPLGLDSLPHDVQGDRHNVWPAGAEADDLTTWGDLVLASPPPLPPPVGGEAYPINKVSVLAPWIGLAVFLIGGVSWFALRRRRTQS